MDSEDSDCEAEELDPIERSSGISELSDSEVKSVSADKSASKVSPKKRQSGPRISLQLSLESSEELSVSEELSEDEERVKKSKKDARALAHRAVEILDMLADAIPDPENISSQMIATRISRFETVLREIRAAVDRINTKGRISRFRSLSTDEDDLIRFTTLLDEVCQFFFSSIRVELGVETLKHEAESARLTALSAITSNERLRNQVFIPLSVVLFEK
ncbi:hypothetical protein B0H10DRAFT_2438487 [Mycena sp. CBHHK59/15]|nr:hypothetical protein B0H10DRAFT_2438487 [Mycena sp. CBHHK59/15]